MGPLWLFYRKVFNDQFFCPAFNFPGLSPSGIMGYGTSIKEMVGQWNLHDNDDDQLFYTKIYLDFQQRVS